MIKTDYMKPTYEEFKTKFSISKARQEELLNTYLQNTRIEEVDELLNEIQTSLYERACSSNQNINKNIEDFKFSNCYLSDFEVDELAKKYLNKEDANDCYPFIFLIQMSIELNEPKLKTLKNKTM